MIGNTHTSRTYIMGTFAGCTTKEARERRMIEALVALYRQRGDMPKEKRQYIIAYNPHEPGAFEIGWDETGLAMPRMFVPDSVGEAVHRVFTTVVAIIGA